MESTDISNSVSEQEEAPSYGQIIPQVLSLAFLPYIFLGHLLMNCDITCMKRRSKVRTNTELFLHGFGDNEHPQILISHRVQWLCTYLEFSLFL